MIINKKPLASLVPALVALILTIPQGALATPVTTDLFFTTFSGTPNVWRTTSAFDGATHTLGAPVPIGTTLGADGIAGNPQNSDLLITGGQGPRVNTISRSTGAPTAYGSPVSVFHLEVYDSDSLFASGIPGALARHGINADGSIGAGTLIPLVGSIGVLTQVISTPSGFYYTSSGPGGNGQFGTLTFDTGNPDTATGITAASLIGVLPAAHGGVYDPFTDTIIVGGDGHITQLSLAGAILSDYTVAGMTFDQGTVDGSGHLYWASNSGHLQFIDYSASGLVAAGTNFFDNQFLMRSLDDVAPLVGGGTTQVPEPSTLAMLALGLALAGFRLRRS